MSGSNKQTDFDILMEYGVDLRKRTLDLKGDVDQAIIHSRLKLLKFLDKTQGEITIYLDSVGGDVNLGLAAHDVIKNCDNPVEIVVEGVAMSMGSIILQAADRRIITKNSRIMIHRGDVCLEGNLNDVKKDLEETLVLDRMCVDIYYERITDKNPDFKRAKLEKMMDSNHYISAEEALELGLVDDIN